MVTAHSIADFLSSTFNPALGLLILEEPLRDQRSASEPWPLFWLRSAMAVGIAVALAETGKHYEVWSGHPLFPSGHATLATAAATCLVLHRGPRWLWVSAPCVLLMGCSLIYGRWHSPDEVLGGCALAVLITLAIFRGARSAR
ncbi:MAG: phosphatase PAP2 family protein [Armatimonadota bacterium]